MGNQRRDPQYKPATAFAGFGNSIIADGARRPLQHLVFQEELKPARAEIRRHVPVCPGVYGWLNADDTLTYIGKSKSLRHRLNTYFATETSDPKMARIRRESRTLIWEPISHELLALIREQELIDRWRPPYNVQGQPDRQQPGFICVGRGVAPGIFFARQVPGRAAESFGPIAGRARLGEAIATLSYVFQLRDCPDRTQMHFSNQLQLFENDRTAQCLRYELDTCPGPCAGSCSNESYMHNVDKALRFLRGRDTRILKRLEERMRVAADQFSFERACVLRDQLTQMKWLDRRMKQLALARRRLNGVWALPGFDRRVNWMILRSGQLLDCTGGDADPRTHTAIIDSIHRQPDVPKTNFGINLLLLLSAWIKKHPECLKSIRKFDDVISELPQSRIA